MGEVPKAGTEVNTPIFDRLVSELGDPQIISYGFLKLLGEQPKLGRRRGRHKKFETIDDVT